MVSHSASEGAAFKGMVNKSLAFEAVFQGQTHPAGCLIREQNVASEGPISDAQFEGMKRKFTEFGETVRSQAPLEHPIVPLRPNDSPAHPGSEGLVLDTVEAMVDRFQGLKVSRNYFMKPEIPSIEGNGDAQTQFAKIESRVMDHATNDAFDAWKNDTVAKGSNETGMKGGQTARRNTEGEASNSIEEIPELEECEAESLEYTFTQPPCISRAETWMRTRCGNHRLHVELPNTLVGNEEDATVHHFFPDFDYGGHDASQRQA